MLLVVLTNANQRTALHRFSDTGQFP